ncbi:MAG: hypothetical protein K2N81_08680, partial [Acetatifactor sp.]|nr:hypothetical protein [Acetatifactor sp.]
MNEKSKNKREWVKTAAIIFLSVLLVLTFFSNTIMNYSLPEVATQYVESGSITAKIRGNGVVESGDPYSVKLKTTGDSNATGVYEVQSVEVRKGDSVQKGDALCYLASSENTTMKALRKQWDEKVKDVELRILEGKLSSSVLTHINNGNLASMTTYQNQVRDKDTEIERLEDELQEAKDTLQSWKDQKENGGTPSATKEKKKLEEAQAAYDEVNEVVEAAQAEIEGWEKEIDENNRKKRDYEDNKLNADGTPAVTLEEYNAAIQNNTILENRIQKKKDEIAPDEAKLPDLKKALDKAQKAYN